MQFLVCFSLMAVSCSGSPVDEWLTFKKVHQKKYANLSEELHRKNIFLKNKKFIDEHNKNFQDGLVSYSMKTNKFADLTNEEYRKLMSFNFTNSATTSKNVALFVAAANDDIPDSIDWREKGAVTAVKDQGDCNSCWAFSSTGALEGQHFLKSGTLVSLSEQNLIDCSRRYENLGCFGGLMENAFKYVSSNGGIDTEASYPYEAKDGECRFKSKSVGTSNSGHAEIPQADEEALKKAVATIGPVSAALDSGEDSFRFYSGGVYYDKNCCPENLIHGILVVGYGTLDGRDYWLIKNSWNTKWGENGYMKLARNRDNHCGIASKALYPLV